MKCQKNKRCVKQPGNALPILKGDKLCTGCNKTGKDKNLKKIKLGKIKEIILAPQIEIEKLRPYIDKVLKALGHPEALVTDESMIGDFLDIFVKKEREKQLKKFIKKFGLNIESDDYIWEVAERIKNERK